MSLLFLFLDGIGLGENNPEVNPFARAKTPTLNELIGDKPMTRDAAPFEGEFASLYALDAGLGVDGLPQSATGQAVLLTGLNIPAEIGYHYGPKPNPEVAQYLNGATIFSKAVNAGRKAALLNGFPPRYFGGIESGKRIYSSIPMAVTNAGLSLFTKDDFYAGRALSADFTGDGWRGFLGFEDAPTLSAYEAGIRLSELSSRYDFSLFEYWASDYAGHKQDMDWAVRQLETFDGVLSGYLSKAKSDLLLITSDHGNMEDLSTRRHTSAKVPLLLIGSREARKAFESAQLLTDVAKGICSELGIG